MFFCETEKISIDTLNFVAIFLSILICTYSKIYNFNVVNFVRHSTPILLIKCDHQLERYNIQIFRNVNVQLNT